MNRTYDEDLREQQERALFDDSEDDRFTPNLDEEENERPSNRKFFVKSTTRSNSSKRKVLTPKAKKDAPEEESNDEHTIQSTDMNADDDGLDEIIQFIDSIQDGIYLAKIMPAKLTKNGNVMVTFDVNVDDEYRYPLHGFFPKVAIKGNLTHLLLTAFNDGDNNKATSFNSLINKEIIISIKVVNKGSKNYVNIADFANAEWKIDTLDVDKYGRFIF